MSEKKFQLYSNEKLLSEHKSLDAAKKAARKMFGATYSQFQIRCGKEILSEGIFNTLTMKLDWS